MPPAETSLPPDSTPVPSAVPAASATPTLEPGVAVWLAPDDNADPNNLAAAAVEQLAADSGMEFEAVALGEPGRLPARTEIVVSLVPADQLAPYIEQWPQLAFIALDSEGQEGSARLIPLRIDPTAAERAAFLAGYSAALLAPNYRVATVTDSAALGRAFQNGARYYCGLCRPPVPPFLDYPLSFQVEGPPQGAGVTQIVDSLVAAAVAYVYLPPGANSPELAQALAAEDIGLLAPRMPVGLTESSWVAAIRPAPEQAVRRAWQALMDGSEPTPIAVPLAVAERNPAQLSTARMRLVEAVKVDLEQGYIEPGG